MFVYTHDHQTEIDLKACESRLGHIECESCYWVVAWAEIKDELLFVNGVQATWGWVKVEHPLTAISPAAEVHANHNQAQNAALGR